MHVIDSGLGFLLCADSTCVSKQYATTQYVTAAPTTQYVTAAPQVGYCYLGFSSILFRALSLFVLAAFYNVPIVTTSFCLQTVYAAASPSMMPVSYLSQIVCESINIYASS
jgi:hypothetical protein